MVKYPDYDAESTRRPVKPGVYDKHGFKLSPDESTLICPKGKLLRVIRIEEGYTRSGFRSDSTVMTCDHCNSCPFRQQCILTKASVERYTADLEISERNGRLRKGSIFPKPEKAETAVVGT